VPSTQFPNMANIFNQLGRKRIPPNVTLTIQMGVGQFPQITTYHVDSDRIQVVGTMLAAMPSFGDFAKTGNSATARAADSATNIAMLRTRFGTEIQFTNAQLFALQHTGPGRITYAQLLLTGQNVYAGASYGAVCAVAPPHGGAVFMNNCAVWGSGSFGICAIEGTLDASNVFVCGCWTHGVYAHTRGGGAWTNCGTYGNAWYGLAVESNAVFTSSAIQSQMNGQYGLYANSGGVLWLAGSLATGNATLDAYAAGNGIINANQSSSLGTSSPPANSGPGNNGGVVLLS